ncbi:MAG: PDZ domain-containing protein [Candidatus Omnitrophica bacterium]|nr:PDZ domain-containing protein [Candidatus Omnitrophota bacterium]
MMFFKSKTYCTKIMGFLFIFSMGIICQRGHADTIVLKNDEPVKGVVVESFKDRVVVSTMDGEKVIMRTDINQLVYDREEQNLVSLAEFYQDKEQFSKAYYCYSKALGINPEYKKAKEGLHYVGVYVINSDRRQKLDHVQKMNEGEKERQGIIKENIVQDKSQKLKDTLGLVLSKVQQNSVVSEVVKGTPAAKAGVQKGDIIFAAWGRSAGYMDSEEILDRLLSPLMDVQITIERDYKIYLEDSVEKYGNKAGIKLGYSEMEGMGVEDLAARGAASEAGIQTGDIVVEVQGQSVRYMTIQEVDSIINSQKTKELSLKIKRDVVIWKNLEETKTVF